MNNYFIHILGLDGDSEDYAGRVTSLCILFVIVFVLFILGLAGSYVNPWLAFDREAIDAGQWWRLLTANFVHLNVNHMLMNISGYVLANLLFVKHITWPKWLLVQLACCLGVGMGLWFIDTNITNYVGLSGALYGMLAFGLLKSMKENRWFSIAVYIYIHYKVIEQQQVGFDSNYLNDFIGGSVVVSSHLYGIILGNIMALVLIYMPKFPR